MTYLVNKYLPPTTLNVVAGGTPVGDITDLQTILDGNEYDLPEIASTPGFDLELNFTNVRVIKGFIIRGYYSGSDTHTVNIKLYNYNSTTDDILFQFPTSTQATYRTVLLPDYTNYVSDTNTAQITFYHEQLGNTQHHLYLDYVALIV